MDIRWLRRLFSALLLVSLIVPALAQYRDEEDDAEESTYASVTLQLDKPGNTNVTLYSAQKNADWTPIIAAASSALRCPVDKFVHPRTDPRTLQYAQKLPPEQRNAYLASLEDANQMSIQAKCPNVMAHRGMMASQTFDFTQTAQALHNAGAQTLTISVNRPDAPSGEFSKANLVALPTTTRKLSNATYVYQLDKPSSAVISISYGLRSREIWIAAGELGLFLVIPAIILMWLRRAALRRGQEDRIAAWFSYFRAASLTVNGFILVWFVTDLNCREQLTQIASFAFGEKGAAFLHIPILFGPAALIYLAQVLLSHRVFVEVRGTNWSRRNYVAQQMLQIGGIWLPMAFLLAGLTALRSNTNAAIGLMFGAFVVRIVCLQWMMKLMQAYPQPLTTGDLRDRIMGMATKMGVKVKHIMVLPAGKAQIANAAAAANNMVMFTDYLLQKLNRREVDAIAAHELTHLKKSHPVKLTLAMLLAVWFPKIVSMGVGFVAGLALVSMRLMHSPAAMIWSFKLQQAVTWMDNWRLGDAILLPIGLAGFYLLSRRFEHQADTGAVMMTQDPEAMISGLVKLGSLNLMPIHWSKKTELMLTHPSTVRRAQYLAKKFGISDAQLQHVIETARQSRVEQASETPSIQHPTETEAVATPVPTYAAEVAPERMQSPSMVRSMQRTYRNLFVMVAGHCVPPALFALAITRLKLPMNARIAGYAAGALLTIAAYAITVRWLALAGRGKVMNEFRQRFEANGIPVSQGGGIFAGYSPSPWPRFYVTSYDWDRGFIFLNKDKLSYIGEQVRFSLTPEQIVNVQLGPGAPSWWRFERLYISWKDAATGRSGIFNMSAAEPCALFKVRDLNRSMQQRLLEWWRKPAESPAPVEQFATLEPPRSREVTCKSPREANGVSVQLKVMLAFVLPASYGVSIMLGVSFAYVLGVAMLVRLYEVIPYLRYRDPIMANPAARRMSAIPTH